MDKNGYIYTSDVHRHEVKKWRIGDPNEIIVAGGNGFGKELEQLYFPQDIPVD